MDDTDLRARLLAMEARAPGAELAPARSRTKRRRLGASIAGASMLSLALAAVAAAGAVGAGALVIPWTADQLATHGHPAAENPGQPLAGAKLECMSPPQAAAYLAARGFTNVVWQVERDGNSTGGQGRPEQESTPPAHGYVVPGAIVDGTLTIVVDQRAGATGVGACSGAPMP